MYEIPEVICNLFVINLIYWLLLPAQRRLNNMYRLFLVALILSGIILTLGFTGTGKRSVSTDTLRTWYEKPVSQWPAPQIDPGVDWKEFEALEATDTSYFSLMERAEVVLGKYLFFDPILSKSNQISCSSCHNPQTSWADNQSVPVGHDHLSGNRNVISLLNVKERQSFFWDGRAATLEDQALGPIEAHNEMAMEADQLPEKLEQYSAYRQLFKDAYGEEEVTFDRITHALAAFQRTITSRQSRFDRFLKGNFKAMNDQEIRGMHLFRTKARCMNCHYGKYFTDELFHNIGLTYYKRKYEDLGRYNVTHDPEDVGKFRTPSLRDIMHTDPWMHNGLFGDIIGVLNMYNSGMQMNTATPEEKAADPLAPVTDPLMQPLNLSREEIQDLAAFLDAITATQYKMRRPEQLPRN